MAVRKIIRMGHPLLRERAHDIDVATIGSTELNRLIDDMVETLDDYGGIGLAAPQIAEPLRLAIVKIPGGATRYGELEAIPLGVYINPTIEVIDSATAGYWEGCLSIPGLRGFVERPQHICVRYLNAKAEPQAIEVHGFTATVFQHEFDHLDGKLYIDAIADTRLIAFEQEYERYLLPREDA